jgi:hypothetical protein
VSSPPHSKVTADEYARCVAQCTALVLDGFSLDTVLASPNGPCASLVGRCDIDSLGTAVELSLHAYSLNAYGVQWGITTVGTC